AAVLLGALARWAGVERLTAGLALGLLLAGWLYAVNGVSILIVRQIPAHEAFHAAAEERAVIIPAALAGVAGALLGRHGTSRVRSRTVVAFLVAGVGVLALIDALFPEHRQSLITAFDPAHVHGISKGLVAPLAGALLLSARGLARGNQRAWQIAVAVLALLLTLNVERRFDEGAVFAGIALV